MRENRIRQFDHTVIKWCRRCRIIMRPLKGELTPWYCRIGYCRKCFKLINREKPRAPITAEQLATYEEYKKSWQDPVVIKRVKARHKRIDKIKRTARALTKAERKKERQQAIDDLVSTLERRF